MERKVVGGLSFKGGRKDQFYFSLFEYFPDKNRWFLKSLLQTKSEKDHLQGDKAITYWLQTIPLEYIVFDFPLDLPACQTCLLTCPGMENCPDTTVKDMQSKINQLISQDKEFYNLHEKNYEKSRNEDNLFDHQKNILLRKSSDNLLSRSFKRRLKKGYLPYWNRPIDLWIWCYYYDQLLDNFNGIYDSFGQSSLMIQSRFNYLRRHIPTEINLNESYPHLILIELLKAQIINQKDIRKLSDHEQGIEARLNIIKGIEKSTNLFIYDKDLETLCRFPRAFDSFLLSIAGLNAKHNMIYQIDDWAKAEQSRFIAPYFDGNK